MANVISWFEIPASNFKRACDFYSTVLGGEIEVMDMQEGNMMGVLPGTDQVSGGAVIYWQDCQPSQQGTCVYLNAGEDLTPALSRVEKAGGRIIMPKTNVAKDTYIAQFIDTEGNKVGLLSEK